MCINIEPNLHLNNDNIKISCPNTRIFPQSMKTRQHCCSKAWFVFYMQEFDPVVPRIDEHIDTTVKRIFPHLRTDKSAEGVKLLRISVGSDQSQYRRLSFRLNIAQDGAKHLSAEIPRQTHLCPRRCPDLNRHQFRLHGRLLTP